jgi:hypothetical protein
MNNKETSVNSNPSGVTANPNALWVNKHSGLICRVLSKTNNNNICEFWVMPSGSQTPIPQVAHTLERLDYKGIDYGGYDITTKQWTKYHFNNIPIARLLWKDKIMVELENGTYEPVERVCAWLKDTSINNPKNKVVDINNLIVDDNLQMRVKMDDSVIDEYASMMAEGVEFPPVTVFEDSDQRYWLVDGFHRYYAYKINQVKEIECSIYKGEFFDAKLYALSANSTHGLKRSNGDKRKAVLEALFDPEISLQSNRQIAKYCGVSRRFVDKLKIHLDQEKNKSTTTKNIIVTSPVLLNNKIIDETYPVEDNIPSPNNEPMVNIDNKTTQSLTPKPRLEVSQLYKVRDNTLKTLKIGQQSKQYKDTKKLFDLFINELIKLYN